MCSSHTEPSTQPPGSRETRVLAVVGPTGVGKSALADELALTHNGEIVSADSMQVYRGMDVGTAKTPVAQRCVPYHCIDVADPDQPFSAALYQRCSRDAFASISSRGLLPVLVGGTGLYVRAALDDWRFPAGEQADSPVRERYGRMLREHGSQALYLELKDKDPAAAELIHPNNSRRVIRALEMHEHGESYAKQHSGFAERRSIYDACILGMTMERGALYSRIDERVDAMISGGLVEEVESLLAAGLRDALTAQHAIGYKEIVPVIEGSVALDEAINDVKQATRRYAKRQLTWFRADSRIIWIDVTELTPAEAVEQAKAAIHWE